LNLGCSAPCARSHMSEHGQVTIPVLENTDDYKECCSTGNMQDFKQSNQHR
jgi:hypothetical protein